ncbi:MAG: hypothetical protein ABI035_00195 [Gemmatimonadaceae bacterium]
MTTSPMFKKLNLKDQTEIVVMNAPSTFETELARLAPVSVFRDVKEVKRVDFAMVFATTRAQLDGASTALANKADEDPTLWIAYPKKSSKRYTCDFNRDSGWDVLRAAGFDSVRIVAIDDDWSALRFRRNKYIKQAK